MAETASNRIVITVLGKNRPGIVAGVTRVLGEANVDIRELIVESAGMHPRETVQHLTHAVLEATGGRLQDDATVLCLDWRGPSTPEAAAAGLDGG